MISVLNPLALYLFALAGLVILAYFLRRRAQVQRVSALFLWREAERKFLRRPRFARRPLSLLLLQLLALSLIVLALAGLAIPRTGIPGKLAILIDGSASMWASVETGANKPRTRYELALRRAEQLIAQAHEVTVIQAQRHPRVLVSLTEDRARARALLLASRPTFQGNASLSQLLEFLKGQAPLSEFGRIVYISDHLPQQPLPEGLPLKLVLVGGGVRDLGILAFSVRREPDPALGYSGFLRVRNYSAQAGAATVSIAAGDRILLSRQFTFPPRSTRLLELHWPAGSELENGGRLTAVLQPETGDDFTWDDRRYLVLVNPPRRVLWLGDEDRFLLGALMAAADIELVGRNEEYDLIVANDTEVPADLGGNILLVHSAYPPLVQLAGSAKVRSLRVEAPSHPLLAGVDVSDIFIEESYPAQLPPGGEVLLSADGVPLIYLAWDKGRKLCYLGFDPRRSNIYLTIDFPILIRNLISWLLPPVEHELEVGDPLPLPVSGVPATSSQAQSQPGVKVKMIIDPRGQPLRIGPQEPSPTELPGFYKVGLSDGRTHYFAVNLSAEELSELAGAPAPVPDAGGGAGRTGSAAVVNARSWSLWRWLALGGLLVLALELWCYDRSPFGFRFRLGPKRGWRR